MKSWEVQKDTKCDENMELIQIQEKIISNRVFFIEYANFVLFNISWYGLPMIFLELLYSISMVYENSIIDAFIDIMNTCSCFK